ncbi:hypothetical protein DCS_05968 [Drechmeria coniospora]|uniref:Protein kinase domain-containing protein n=1 Tax=Drechmeria coniospora TaxID=98403 RepID=A0A151GAB3_DRECN|nr:hypothetical protein DCS_05968 [Drechmeria coniospora]KYK54018.1 hypothetical protein DCS_05968 [Drechmeria coniospora]
MEEIEELRRRLQLAEDRAQEEQRLREEEQRLREEEQRLREEEQRLREEEQRLRKEEQYRRKAVERLTAASQPQRLQHYLEGCHALHLAGRVITDPTLTTQGETTNPAGRIFPRRITPWNDFAARQEQIWSRISTCTSFSEPAFPSQHQLDYVKSLLKPISSELGLRDFEQLTVESAVEKLVAQAYADPSTRNRLGLRGTVIFESHTNLGTSDDVISDRMEQMSLDGGTARSTPPVAASRPSAPRARRRARGKGNRADQFCMYRVSDGEKFPALAIEYKAPHKLSVDEIVTGLECEIRPERDVINKDGQGFDFTAKRLSAAVVTQLFSYMVGKGIQYGYVCTGRAFVFLRIPSDPSVVYISVCVPGLDVMDDDETRLHRTAVAQVFAFTLQALGEEPPPAAWHDKAEALGTWAVEYDDILRNIPLSERKRKEPRASPYKPQRWKGFHRSPIRTRSYCRPTHASAEQPEDNDEDPPSPTPSPSRAAGKSRAPAAGSGAGMRGQRKHEQQQQQQQQRSSSKPEPGIQSRPFCTQRCLFGLAYGGAADEHCPNAGYHKQARIDRLDFLRLIRDQLATDRGPDADCTPLHRSGSRGSLFKVRLSSHGYTLVAKGVESLDAACLQHEIEMYNRLQPIQGQHVPVCLGSVDLVRPCYYDSGVYKHFMFLSWAGEPLFHYTSGGIDPGIENAATAIFKAMHKLRVLHRDAEPRNMLYNAETGRLMVVDFERAEFRQRDPLGVIVPNVQRRRRKRGAAERKTEEDFARELKSAVDGASRFAC